MKYLWVVFSGLVFQGVKGEIGSCGVICDAFSSEISSTRRDLERASCEEMATDRI